MYSVYIHRKASVPETAFIYLPLFAQPVHPSYISAVSAYTYIANLSSYIAALSAYIVALFCVYGAASVSRIDTITGLFCKRAL